MGSYSYPCIDFISSSICFPSRSVRRQNYLFWIHSYMLHRTSYLLPFILLNTYYRLLITYSSYYRLIIYQNSIDFLIWYSQSLASGCLQKTNAVSPTPIIPPSKHEMCWTWQEVILRLTTVPAGNTGGNAFRHLSHVMHQLCKQQFRRTQTSYRKQYHTSIMKARHKKNTYIS